jgi:hypothetical protein
MMRLVGRWLPGRERGLVADSRFAALALLDKVKTLPRASVIPRRRLDAGRDDPAPPREPGTNGRPRLPARRRPPLASVLADEKTPLDRVDRGAVGGGRAT